MSAKQIFAALAVSSILFCNAQAYPIVDAVVGLPYPELVTVYPDEYDHNLYYFVPTTVELVRDASDKPKLGVTYWGFTGIEPGGAGAALTFSVRPAYDKDKLQAVADAVKQKNANARWAAVPLICSRMAVLLNGAYYPKNQSFGDSTVTSPANTSPTAMLANQPATASPAAATPAPGSPQGTTPPAETAPAQDDGDTLVDQASKEAKAPPSYCQMMGPDSPVASKGGTVDSTQAFSVSLSSIGAKAFAQGVAPDVNVLGARYTYVFRGIGKRLHARVTVYWKRVYDHFKAQATGHAFWGLVKSSWSTDWQSLTSDGNIKLEYLEGGSTTDADYMMTIFQTLVNAKISGTGMFKPQLTSAGIQGAPESVNVGWGFSGGGGWEHLQEDLHDTFEISRQSLEEREFSVGLSFNTVCAQYPNSFADLTTIGNKCITQKMLVAAQKAADKCLTARYKVWKDRLDKGLINQAVYEKQIAKIADAPCYGT